MTLNAEVSFDTFGKELGLREVSLDPGVGGLMIFSYGGLPLYGIYIAIPFLEFLTKR